VGNLRLAPVDFAIAAHHIVAGVAGHPGLARGMKAKGTAGVVDLKFLPLLRHSRRRNFKSKPR
jgi:hypothetical protein